MDYNVIWNTQSADSSGSMPLGGHDAGCNVWVQDNELCLYLSQSGAFDENGTMLKAGRFRIAPEDREVLSVDFRQELELEKGQITITAGRGKDAVRFVLWQDVTNANLHIDFQSGRERTLRISYDCWRYLDREVNPEERGQCRNLATQMEDALEERILTLADEVQV